MFSILLLVLRILHSQAKRHQLCSSTVAQPLRCLHDSPEQSYKPSIKIALSYNIKMILSIADLNNSLFLDLPGDVFPRKGHIAQSPTAKLLNPWVNPIVVKYVRIALTRYPQRARNNLCFSIAFNIALSPPLSAKAFATSSDADRVRIALTKKKTSSVARRVISTYRGEATTLLGADTSPNQRTSS